MDTIIDLSAYHLKANDNKILINGHLFELRQKFSNALIYEKSNNKGTVIVTVNLRNKKQSIISYK